MWLEATIPGGTSAHSNLLYRTVGNMTSDVHRALGSLTPHHHELPPSYDHKTILLYVRIQVRLSRCLI